MLQIELTTSQVRALRRLTDILDQARADYQFTGGFAGNLHGSRWPLHDLDLVKSMFPEALLLAREPVAWGATAEVLTAENLLKARRMCEAFDEHAHECAA